MKFLCSIQSQKRLLPSFALGLVVAMSSILSVPANGQVVVFDTGLQEQVLFNGNPTFLGWTSGNAGAGNEQRWTAQPFTLGDETLVTQINAGYFEPGAVPANIGIMIWNRTGETAPTTGDEVFATTVANPGSAGNTAWTELALGGGGPTLAAGDYYLSIYGIEATIGWFTGAPDGINFIDGAGAPYMWRAATYPAPGFEVYQLDPAVLSAAAGDPNDVYNAAFQITTIPEPGSISLLAVAAVGLLIRRRR